MATLIRIYKDRITIRSGLTKEKAERKGAKFEKKNEGSPLWQVVDQDLSSTVQRYDLPLEVLPALRPGFKWIKLTAPVRLTPDRPSDFGPLGGGGGASSTEGGV